MRGWRGDAARCLLDASQYTLEGENQFGEHDAPTVPAKLGLEVLAGIRPETRCNRIRTAFHEGGSFRGRKLPGQPPNRNAILVDDQPAVAALLQANGSAGGNPVRDRSARCPLSSRPAKPKSTSEGLSVR